MLIHPDRRAKLGIELAGGINKSDHALQLAQEAYKDALRWSVVKRNSLVLSSPTPVPTYPTRQRPAPTESGPVAPLSPTKTLAPNASPPTLSQARSLCLRQEMLLRRELNVGKGGGPTKPKAPPPTLSTEENSTYGATLATRRKGRKIIPDPTTRHRPRLPRQGRPRRKLGRRPRSIRQGTNGPTTQDMASLVAAFLLLMAFTPSLLGCAPKLKTTLTRCNQST